jgi:hypothetical protein
MGLADDAREALTSAIHDAINFAGMSAADIGEVAASIEKEIEEEGGD